MSETPGLQGLRSPRVGAPEALSTALAKPLIDLHDEYLEAERLVGRIKSGLHDLRERLSSGETSELRVRRTPMVRIEVSTEDMPAVLAFQREVADLPSVSAVTVAGAGTGRASLLVHLKQSSDEDAEEAEIDDDGPIVCVECGRTLRAGAGPPSHGLCPECTATFLRRGRMRG